MSVFWRVRICSRINFKTSFAKIAVKWGRSHVHPSSSASASLRAWSARAIADDPRLAARSRRHLSRPHLGRHAAPGARPRQGLPRLDGAAAGPPGRGLARRPADRRGAGADRPRPRRRLRRSAVSKEVPSMPQPGRQARRAAADPRIEREARRILRRLCEKGAFLAVAPTMEKAVVLREVVPGKQNRIAVVDRDVAHAFALQEWIACEQGRQDRLLHDHRGRPRGAEAAADRGARRAGAERGLRRGAGAVPGAAPLLRRADGDGRGRLGRAAAALQPRREPAVGARPQARQGRRAPT